MKIFGVAATLSALSAVIASPDAFLENTIMAQPANLTENALNGTTHLGDSISYYGYEQILYSQQGANIIGGLGGTFFMDHKYGSTVRDINVWGGAPHGGLKAIELIMFDGTRFLRGDNTKNGLPIGTFAFQPNEKIKGDLTLSGNGIGTRMGYLYFKTNLGNTFEVGDRSHDHYNFPADGRYMTGLFGHAGDDIDRLGVYFSKVIKSTSLTGLHYPTLDTSSPLCRPPANIYSTHFKNPNPIGTPPDSTQINFSALTGSNRCWAIESSFAFDENMEVSGGVPGIEKVDDKVSWHIATSAKYNKCTKTEKTVSETQTIYIPAMQECNIYVTQCQGQLNNIPYTGALDMYFSDGTMFTMNVSGSYQGAEVLIADVDPECKPL